MTPARFMTRWQRRVFEHWVLPHAVVWYDTYLGPRQLTAGPASLDAGQLAEALEWMLRDLAACSCQYVRHYARVPIYGRHTVRARTIVVATGFQIDPDCPHHGDHQDIPRVQISRDHWAWEEILTDDSERGHDETT